MDEILKRLRYLDSLHTTEGVKVVDLDVLAEELCLSLYLGWSYPDPDFRLLVRDVRDPSVEAVGISGWQAGWLEKRIDHAYCHMTGLKPSNFHPDWLHAPIDLRWEAPHFPRFIGGQRFL